MYNRQSDHYNDPINQNIDFFSQAGIVLDMGNFQAGNQLH
jgi:hypothetical protein